MKVSVLWRMFTLVLFGVTIGIFVTVKYISPPSQDITIGKIKIKGQNNTTDGMVRIVVSDAKTENRKPDAAVYNNKEQSKIKAFFKRLFNKKQSDSP